MHSRVPSRGALAAALGGLLAGTLSFAPAVQAAPVPLTDPVAAAALAASLGDTRTGGVYYRDGRLVVAVTDEAAAASVKADGGVAELVKYDTAYLDSIHTALDRLAGIPGTSWGVDPSTNTVEVEMDSTVSFPDQTRLTAAAAAYGDAVTVSRVSGTYEPAFTVIGGQGIYSPGSDGTVGCTLGFNVQNGSGTKFFVTAGHCVVGHTDWYRAANDGYLGYRYGDYDYGDDGNDYAVVKYANSAVTPYGTVKDENGDQAQITRSITPSDGMPVKRTGTTSSDYVGAILVPSTTVTYTDGTTLTGMIKTSLCVKHGDSGGPMWSGDGAVGITSGGTDLDEPCNSGVSDHRSFYQPMWDVESQSGLKVY